MQTAIFTEFQDKLLCYGKVDDTKQWTESSGPFETQEDAYKEVMRCVLRHDALTLPKTSDTELYQYLSLILPTNEQGQVEVKSEHAEIICDYVDTRVRLGKVTYEMAVRECSWNDEFFTYALRQVFNGKDQWIKNDDLDGSL